MLGDEFAASLAVIATLVVVAVVWYRQQRSPLKVTDFIRSRDVLDD